ncbi:hypothetical protein [Pseudovibrio brasiliensis]|uniref:Bacteriocin n=1 Tax=Pseudovibrio brasiliensis TaxID=1898042 RepID=A0ABX8AJS2_9HYPH|nr:hypothetical protein [Pseudovibrio brasiliensis]QUS54497.1 hypothetical protein KGB56_13965 [Pseudovibrio brasiliensis]
MKKELSNTTSLKQPKPLNAKELMRVLGNNRANRAVGVKGGQSMVKRQ